VSWQDEFNEQVRNAREDVRRAQERARQAREDWRRWQREQHSAQTAAAQEEWRRAGEDLRRSFQQLEIVWKSFEQGWARGPNPPNAEAKPEAIAPEPGKDASMGRRRRTREEDDFARKAGEKLRDFLDPQATPERERLKLERERLREERRRRRSAESQADLIATGIGLAAGGLVSLLAVPVVAAVGAGLVAGGITGAGLRWLAVRRLSAPALPKTAKVIAPALNAEGLNEARAETLRAILDHAAEQLREVQAAAAHLPDAEAQDLFARLARTGQQIIDRIAERPELLPRAQRVLTYHVERAVYLAETLGAVLASKAADPQQIVSAKHVLARMDNLFERTALELTAGDAKEMDLELRLIDQALDEDLKP